MFGAPDQLQIDAKTQNRWNPKSYENGIQFMSLKIGEL